MKILVTPTSFGKPENAGARELIESFADEVVYNETGVPLAGDELVAMLSGCDGYVAGVDYITADVIAAMPESVKVISRYGAGIDRVDMDACRKRGVTVTNTPGANSTAVCELAFGLMLCAARAIPALDAQVRNGEWPRANGMELAGRTLGIVGMGAIGKKIAKRAVAFEMNVVAYDPYFDEAFAAENGVKRMDLDELFAASDVVTLHVPLSDATRHIANEQRMRSMKRGGIVINTARGGLIDEEAAAKLLKEGHLRGLGLDAFEKEPPTGGPLDGLAGVIFTPHTGAHTAEAVANMGRMAVENAIAVLSGKECRYIIK